MIEDKCLFGLDGILKTDICHHGIKGQKWGVRRYQNPDGTLTPAGRKRYRKSKESAKHDSTRVNKLTSLLDQIDVISKNSSGEEKDRLMRELMPNVLSLYTSGDSFKPEIPMTGFGRRFGRIRKKAFGMASENSMEQARKKLDSFIDSDGYKNLFSTVTKSLSEQERTRINHYLDKVEKINKKIEKDGKTKETDKMIQNLMTDMVSASITSPNFKKLVNAVRPNENQELLMGGSKLSKKQKESFGKKAKKIIHDVLTYEIADFGARQHQDFVNQTNLMNDTIHQINTQSFINQMMTTPAPMPMFMM